MSVAIKDSAAGTACRARSDRKSLCYPKNGGSLHRLPVEHLDAAQAQIFNGSALSTAPTFKARLHFGAVADHATEITRYHHTYSPQVGLRMKLAEDNDMDSF